MVENPPDGNQRVIPYLTYADAPAAVEFLCSAFGFEVGLQLPMGEGVLGHAELRLGGHVLMLSSAFPEMGLTSPRELPALHSQVMVYVDDVDAHHAQAAAAGATITQDLADQFYGDRTYHAVDPEGHSWTFAQHVRDVSEEELSAAAAEMAGGEG